VNLEPLFVLGYCPSSRRDPGRESQEWVQLDLQKLSLIQRTAEFLRIQLRRTTQKIKDGQSARL
jgi:hypothetical protein